MYARILIWIVTFLIAISAHAIGDPHSCELLARESHPFTHARRSGALPPIQIREVIDLPENTDLSDLDREFLQALVRYHRELNDGSMSFSYRDFALPKYRDVLMDLLEYGEPQQTKEIKEMIAEVDGLHLFSPTVENAFVELAKRKHQLSLRCLGHVYRFGIGVEIDLAISWAYYDTYNLVAGIDGKDEFRDAVEGEMSDIEILAGQGLARTFRDLYTDAWKVPSTTLIN